MSTVITMYEFEKYEYEFSKIYKRMLRLELLIKHKIINLSTKVYKNDVMNVFSKFFNNAYIYNKYCSDTKKENYFLAIRDSKSIDDVVKFERIINMLMLRHTLHFIFTEEAFRVDEIKDEFYALKIEEFKELRNNREALIALRNHIAHFNFKAYSLKKKEYLHSLLLFEYCLGCSLGKFGKIPSNLGRKPNMTKIIETIFDLCPELFMKDVPHEKFPYNKDRIIVDLYEDIAVLNGWEYNELKSQWDVIRKKYDFNSKKSEKENRNDLEIARQTSIFEVAGANFSDDFN